MHEWSGANRDQADYWTAQGETWVRFQEGLDQIHEAPLRRLLECAAPAASERVLDIGCGAGASAFAVASAVGEKGHVTGVDISAPLLDRAEERRVEAGLDNVRFLLADAQTHPFEEGTFDLAISRFGVMFFDDPPAAFRNIATCLRPGGRIVFIAWAPSARNPWFDLPRAIAADELGPAAPADPAAPGPFAFAATDYVLRILEGTGLEECWARTEKIELEFAGTLEAAASVACGVGAATRIIRQYQADEAAIARIERRVAEAFQPFAVAGRVRIPALVNLCGASRA
ncbi:MAG: class I SAM-dependent methyltransferase [Geminicoccaceae bacterium]